MINLKRILPLILWSKCRASYIPGKFMTPDIHLPGSAIALLVTAVPARGETSQGGEILASHGMLRGVYFLGIMSLRLDVQFPQVLIRSALFSIQSLVLRA